MSIIDYKEYLEKPAFDESVYGQGTLGECVVKYDKCFESGTLEGGHIALIGVSEKRRSTFAINEPEVADSVRQSLYALKQHQSKIAVCDLGNLKAGKTIEDTYAAVALISAELMRNQIIPVIIGGSQDITFGQYAAYKQLAQIINIVNIDSQFDLGNGSEACSSSTFIGQIIMEQPNYLFNYSHLGHQQYFVGDDAIEKMNKLYFDTYRLGQVRADITDVEPVIRNSDLITFDLSAIRQSDFPAGSHPSPNGFKAEEACQMMFYAGMSEKISSVGLYEMDLARDSCNQSSLLVSQMLWYFIEGLSKRKGEVPAYNRNGYTKYIVRLESVDTEIVFLKSTRTDRWWMELPIQDNYTKFQRHHIVPCSIKDYKQALNNEMPERWWITYKKLS